MPALLLTAQDSSGHIHLIIGANSLASVRCTKSIEVGAKAKVIARADAEVHYALRKKIDNGSVEWIQKEFEDTDLSRLGRKEIDHVVDAVFVTVGEGDAQCIKSGSIVDRGSLTQCCRRSHLKSLPTFADPGQRDRYAEPLHILAALYVFGWTATDRDNNLGQRLQTCFSDPTGNHSMPPS